MAKAARLLMKRCERCGWTGRTRARRRTCHRPRGLTEAYRCGGRLVLQARPAAVPGRPQDAAARKLAQARRQVVRKAKALARMAQSLIEWERKARRYAVQADRTDADLQAERERRLAAAEKAAASRRRKRGINLEGMK